MRSGEALESTYNSNGLVVTVTKAATPSTNGTAPTNDPVYRFYDSAIQGHFYTTNTAEKDSLINNYSQGYSYEGIVFTTSINAGAGLIPVWRFYNPTNADHFFTANASEESNLIKPNSGYNYEGIAFYAYGATSNVDSAVYRYYNTNTGQHFFTANTSEIAGLTSSGSWNSEGVAFRASL